MKHTSLVPKSNLSQGQRSGNNWAISGLCQVSSIDFEWRYIDYMLAWPSVGPISLAYTHAWMHGMALFHWLVKNKTHIW